MDVAAAAGASSEELDAYAASIRDAGLQAIGDEQAAAIAAVGEAAGLSADEIDVLTASTRELAIAQAEAADAAKTQAAAQGEADVANDESAGSLAGIGRVGFIAAAAVAAVAVISVKSAMDYQSATASLEGQAHLTASAAGSIATAFLNTAGKVTFSAQTIMTAYAPVAAQLGQVQGHALSAAQAMQVMNAAMDLAEATGTSLTSATSALASVMQAYSLNASQAATTSNQLFNIARDTGSSISSVAAMVQKLHTQLGAVAPPLDQVGALMVDLANHGETGRGSVSALKTAFTDFLKPATDVVTAQQALKVATDALPPSLQALAAQVTAGTISSSAATTAAGNLGVAQGALFAKFTSATGAMATANQAQAQMGITAVNAQGKLLPLGNIIGQLHNQIAGMSTAQATAKLASDGFGSSAGKLVGIVQGGVPAFDKATASVNAQNAVSKAAAEQQHTFEGELKTTEAALDDVSKVIGIALLPALTEMLKVVLSALGPLIKFATTHKQITAIVLGVVAVLATLVGAVYLVTKAVGLFGEEGALSFVKVAAKAVASAATTTASWLVSAATTAASWIATAAVAVARTAVTVAASVAGAVASAAAWVAGAVATAAAWVIANAAILGVIGIIVAVVAAAVYEIVTHWHDISRAAMIVFDLIKGYVLDAVHWIENHWQLLLAILTGPIGIAVDIISTYWDDIKQWAADAVDWIESHWELLVEILTGPIGIAVGLWQHFHDEIISFFEDILAKVVSIWQQFMAAGSAVVSAVIGFFARLPGEIAGFFEQIWSDVVSVWDQITGDAANAVTSIVNWFEGLPGKVVSAVSGLLGDMLSFGEKIVSNIVSGIGNVAGSIGSAIEHAIPGASTVVGWVSHLAAGGLVTGPTLAVVGEAGPELVLPLSDLPGGASALGGGGIGALPAMNTGFGGGGGQSFNTQIVFAGQVYGSLDALAQKLGAAMATRYLPQAGVNVPH